MSSRACTPASAFAVSPDESTTARRQYRINRNRRRRQGLPLDPWEPPPAEPSVALDSQPEARPYPVGARAPLSELGGNDLPAEIDIGNPDNKCPHCRALLFKEELSVRAHSKYTRQVARVRLRPSTRGHIHPQCGIQRSVPLILSINKSVSYKTSPFPKEHNAPTIPAAPGDLLFPGFLTNRDQLFHGFRA